MKKKIYIIGAGFTGLGAGLTSKFKIFESKEKPGGICASYKKEGFRFEIGGGHWIFGRDELTLSLLNTFALCKSYKRKSAIFFSGEIKSTKSLRYKFIDYPIQNNLYALGEKLSKIALKEIIENSKIHKDAESMADWLKHHFGETLFEAFFKPFHERYTAGLYTMIAPQDPYKTPFDIKAVINGASGNPDLSVGYNVRFVYPEEGLDILSQRIAEKCDVVYCKNVEKIYPSKKIIKFSDGKEKEFDYLLSTIPLNKILKLSGISEKSELYTSVMVINMGVELGDSEIARHGNHWLYIPDSLSGFHRVGYYSNVDSNFLPKNHKNPNKFGSLYIEFAFKPEKRRLDEEKTRKLIDMTSDELKSWGFIKKVLVVDTNWIDVAYTWQTPKSNWVKESIEKLRKNNIISIGRYGRWCFQGILESFKEGLFEGIKHRI
jgi:protoporphyrinogen oxidase